MKLGMLLKEQGTATSCYVAMHPSLKGVTGKYFIDCNEKEPSNFVRDEKLWEKLWDFNEELVKAAKLQ